MSSLQRVLDKLPNAKRNGTGWKACCPSHDDKTPSLSITDGEDGTVLLKCFAGCQVSDIVAALGLTLRNLFPDPISPRSEKPKAICKVFSTADAAVKDLERQLGDRSGMWVYHDAGGEPVGVVLRWNAPAGKTIRPVSRCVDGWYIGAMQEPRLLHLLPEVMTADRVVITEGEKCADAARSLGFTATTSAGGSQAATPRRRTLRW